MRSPHPAGSASQHHAMIFICRAMALSRIADAAVRSD
jgi:hypothetical protein